MAKRSSDLQISKGTASGRFFLLVGTSLITARAVQLALHVHRLRCLWLVENPSPSPHWCCAWRLSCRPFSPRTAIAASPTLGLPNLPERQRRSACPDLPRQRCPTEQLAAGIWPNAADRWGAFRGGISIVLFQVSTGAWNRPNSSALWPKTATVQQQKQGASRN